MNHITFHSKLYLWVIVLVLAASGVLIATEDTRIALQSWLQDLVQIKVDSADVRPAGPSRMEELARIKDDLVPVDGRISGPSKLEELARIKDDVSSLDTRFTGPSRLEEIARIKEDMTPIATRLSKPSRLEELERIKGDFVH